ncbi:MAG: glycosyltransferase family 4 protein [Bacteroides sp.]|nr:glycosyltransferase family 4 protein [Bacteroides sp.]
MAILFVGSYCPQSYTKELLETGTSPDFAGINLQAALLDGFEKNNIEVTYISIPNRLSYPQSSKIFISGKYFNDRKNEKIVSNRILGFINLPIIKIFSKYFRMRRAIKSYLDYDKNSCDLFVYSLNSPFLLAAISYRKRFRSTCVMITDLPEYMSGNRSILYKIGKYIDKKIINYCLKRFNTYVLLSNKMKDKLPITHKKYITIEGIYTATTIQEVIPSRRNAIMYAGGISQRYNVFDLIEAFLDIKDSTLELWLCGPIADIERFNSIINNDKRIKYLGLLPIDKVRALQKQVSLLINPRMSIEEFTKYSFPSKTLEYMASGTPTMMCRLPSLPSEYLDYLYFIDIESKVGIQAAIEHFFTIPIHTRMEKAKKAQEFIMLRKSAQFQTRKVLELIHTNIMS